MKPQIVEATQSSKPRRVLSDKARWGLILAQFAVVYALSLVSLYQAWPGQDYLRFLLLVPLYHAGASFGYTGGLLAGLLSVVLFLPIIPISNTDPAGKLTPQFAGLTLVFYVFFGFAVGGAVGANRKTRRYVDTLSNIFMRILAEPDERSVALRACREAAAVTDAAEGAALVRVEGKPDPADWVLLDALGGAERSPGTDNALAWCARRNAALATNSAAHDERFRLGADAAGLRSFMAIPVAFEENIYGALLLADRKKGENFTGRDLSIARTIAETAAGAIHNIVQEKERQEERLREEQMRELFSRFVSSSVADYVLEHPGLLDGRWQKVTVLVSDVRDFTGMSEKIPARDLVAQLNEYFTAMVNVVFDNKGTIDKFIGDCIIAYWGAPAPDPVHAANAVRTASAMSGALDALNASWAARGMPPFSTGIAIHTCDVLIGNLGDDRKKAFTIMGEEVEKAIAMESLTKALGARTVVSEAAALAAGPGARLRELTAAPDEFGRLFTIIDSE